MFLDKCHNIPQASIDALGKLMRRTTSQREANAVVISDIEAQYIFELTPLMSKGMYLLSVQYHHDQYTYIYIYIYIHEQTFMKFVYSLFL